MEKYIGMPYVDVKNPFGNGHANYAKHFEAEFEESIINFGIYMDFRYQADMYRSGKYTDYIITALKKRGEIFDIIDSFRTQEAAEGEREAYYPVNIYCPPAARTRQNPPPFRRLHRGGLRLCLLAFGKVQFPKGFQLQVAWKVDWPMRWAFEGVDFEPGGKDHASPTGSYQTSKVIAEKIFGFEPPVFQGYEFIGIRGTVGKMSSSSGLNLTPETMLKLYQPEIILWLFSKTEPTKAFDFCFDDGILRQYFEFDKMYNEVEQNTAGDYTRTIMYYKR